MSCREDLLRDSEVIAMKVCHIASGDLWAGAEVMVYQLLNGLRRCTEIDLCAVILNEGKLASEIRRLGYPLR
jgi:hypothetical protein